MGLRIRTNLDSLAAQRNLSNSRKDFGDSLEKLSSGQRINKSADDAAGLAVSERIRATTRSLSQSKRNASDGVSYIQVAEGGLNEVSNIIIRMRELGSQAASDTIGNRERGYLDKEFQQLRQEVGRIVDSTDYNGTKVLKSENDKAMQIFVGASNRASDADGNAPDVQEGKDPDVISLDFKDIQELQKALAPVMEEGGLAVVPSSADGGAGDLGSGGTNDMFNKLDTALSSIAGYRATLGSIQSRLGSTMANIDVANENLQAAQSRIRDVDFATESTKFTQAKILTQAGTSVLAQANQSPEFALSLIR